MTIAIARAYAVHVQADLRDAVAVLCWMASASHALGSYQERDDSINAARDLMADLLRDDPSRFGEDGVE
jgi:hypothetical protein